MKTIALTKGQFAIVSDEDFETLSEHKWHATWNTKMKKFYAARSLPRSAGKRKSVMMHRAVLGIEDPKTHADHIDGNTLNNTRENLRAVTPRANHQNHAVHRNGKLVGCTFSKQKQKWRAALRINGKWTGLGYFDTEQEAHDAYIKAVDLLLVVQISAP